MNAHHIIAVDTYGAQRITDPATGTLISAYKLGYSSAVADVLVALYGAKARDVSPKQATYRYLRIDSDVIVRHGHMLLTLTDNELARVEAITRRYHRAAVYLWRDRKWWELPDSTRSDYADPGYRDGPAFDPTGFRPPCPATGERECAATGITVERSQREDDGRVWWWLSGDTYPHRETLKRYGARWSGKRQAWYWMGAELPEAILALVTNKAPSSAPVEHSAPANAPVFPVMSPELISQIEAVLAADDAKSQALPVQEAPPAIRVIKPVSIADSDQPPDAVQTAIHEMKMQPFVTPTPSPSTGRIAHLEQAFVGELTGSITGQVFCYGYAVHDGICVYVNMAGPRMGVEAIRAKLSKGDIVSVVPRDAPSVELTAGEGNSGMYHPYLHYLPEARFASLILVHDFAVTPNYGGKSTTFIFRTSDAQAIAKLRHHVMQLVNVPVFEAWALYLYEAGQRAMLVRRARSQGGVDLLSVELDADAWTRLITGGLEEGVIRLPE